MHHSASFEKFLIYHLIHWRICHFSESWIGARHFITWLRSCQVGKHFHDPLICYLFTQRGGGRSEELCFGPIFYRYNIGKVYKLSIKKSFSLVSCLVSAGILRALAVKCFISRPSPRGMSFHPSRNVISGLPAASWFSVIVSPTTHISATRN